MKLSNKTLLVPLCTVSLLVTGIYSLVSRVTIESFDLLEKSLLQKQLARVDNTVGNIVEDHAKKISDWAQWDNTYDFIKTLNPKYINETLNSETLTALGFNSVIYLTPDNKLRYGVQIENDEVKPVSAALVSELISITANDAAETKGLFSYNDHVLLIAAAPILPNKGDAQSRGKIVATADFGKEVIERIRYQTNLKITPLSNVPFKNTLRSQSVNEAVEGTAISIVAADLAYAFGRVNDLRNHPVFTYRIEDSRDAVANGLRIRYTATLVLLGAGALAALFIAAFINKFAVNRIELFSKSVSDIWHSKNLSLRINDLSISQHSLRLRTAAGIIGLFLATTALSYLFLNNYFLEGFAAVERSEMQADLERGKRALLGRLEILKGKVTDWAQWDDTYQFIEDRNSDYISANLEFDTLGSMGIKYVLYFNRDNKLVIGRRIDQDAATVTDVGPSIGAEVSSLVQVSNPASPISGILSLSEGPILLGASPILDTSREKPSRGGMIFASAIDSYLQSELAKQTRLALKFKASSSSVPSGVEIAPMSEEILSGTISVPDIAGRPALDIQISSPRQIFFHGRRAAHLLPIYFALCGLLCTVITVLFVDRLLLDRIRQLGTDVTSVQSSDDGLGRVNVTGKDELSGLASNINRMLEALEAAQADVRVAKEIAERANQAKSMFIARVSHELRTPVAGIIGLNDMLLKRVGDQRGVRELLNMQGVSAEGLLTIINEILDFSTIEQGKLTFENIEFEPRTVAKEAMQVVTGRLLVRPANAPLQLVIDVAPTVARKLKGDPTKLKQILVNLIGNGIKFTQRGNVGLKLDCTKNESGKQWLQFSVWDTGIGIPASKLATVFEPFTQADESVRRKYQGTGLGLTIVKQMAEGMGGAVSVESVEGSGSTFKVTIPFEAASAAPYDVSGESTGRGIWPTSFTVIGESCRVRDSVVEGLSLFGGKSNGVFEHVNHENAKAIKDSKLIVLLEDAAQSLEGQKLIKEKAAHGVIVPVISLAQGELRQKLHTDGVRTILSYPVLADDIVSALITERMVSYQDAAASIVRSLPTCSRPLRILVADDTLTNRIVLEDLLTEAGHSVVCVDDGQKLVERLRPMLTGENDAEGFDIVLTDISMPTMDGYSATKEIRALEKDSGHHIPIVAITAHILTEEQAKMKASGMDEVLTKPIKPEAVAAVFETLVKD